MVLQEVFRQLRAERNLTNAQISSLTGVPIGTVNRYFSKTEVKDPSMYTIGPLSKLFNFSLDQYFDIRVNDDQREQQDRELTIACRELRVELATKDEMIAAMKKELNIRRWITAALVLALAAVAVLAAGYLIYFDLSDPNHGIFRDAAKAFLMIRGG